MVLRRFRSFTVTVRNKLAHANLTLRALLDQADSLNAPFFGIGPNRYCLRSLEVSSSGGTPTDAAMATLELIKAFLSGVDGSSAKDPASSRHSRSSVRCYFRLHVM